MLKSKNQVKGSTVSHEIDYSTMLYNCLQNIAKKIKRKHKILCFACKTPNIRGEQKIEICQE